MLNGNQKKNKKSEGLSKDVVMMAGGGEVREKDGRGGWTGGGSPLNTRGRGPGQEQDWASPPRIRLDPLNPLCRAHHTKMDSLGVAGALVYSLVPTCWSRGDVTVALDTEVLSLLSHL